jgi:alkanesulfonate monooxygenase
MSRAQSSSQHKEWSMSVEFIGYIATQPGSEIHPRSGPTIQPDYVEKVARAHEAAGFDRALVAYHSNSPDSAFVAAYAASVTRTLKFLIAHRPGFISPTVAARQFATAGCVYRWPHGGAYHYRWR